MPRWSLLLLLAGCPPRVTPETTEPAPVPATPDAADCEVELHTTTERTADGTFLVSARARNRTDAPITLSVPDTCPDGPARFTGLRDGYDWYGTCVAGACPGPRGRRDVVVAVGGDAELTGAWIDPARSPCNEPLAPGAYTIGWTMDVQGARTCGPAEVALVVP